MPRMIAITLAVVATGITIWISVDQLAWRFLSRPNTYLTALGPVAAAMTAALTGAAGVAAVVYVILTYHLWREIHHTNQAALMQQLMKEYDDLRESIMVVQDYYLGFPSDAEAPSAFQSALAAPDKNNEIVTRVDPARFRVSRFFVKIRKLVNEGFLESRIVIAALDRAAVEQVFLERIDPLDQVVCRLHYGKENPIDTRFFTELLKRYPQPAN